MNLVFCMAGLYQRFKNAGYTAPKFLLPFRGRTTLEHVITEMALSRGACDGSQSLFRNIILVANQRDQVHATAIAAILESLQLDKRGITAHTHWVPDTRGQADTASLGVDALERHAHAGIDSRIVFFHNIDTILLGRDFRAIAQAFKDGADGYVDCIDSTAPQYSYVATSARPGEEHVATDIREKVVISRHATTGLYGFRSAADYRVWAKGVDYTKEFYISDVYRSMLRQGRRVVINTSHTGHETIIVGTPAEYESLASPAEVAAARCSPHGVTP